MPLSSVSQPYVAASNAHGYLPDAETRARWWHRLAARVGTRHRAETAPSVPRESGGRASSRRLQRDELARAVTALTTRAAGEHTLPAVAAHGELHLEYQPIVDLTSGHLRAVEALARWRHPRLGPVNPATFILAAERSGAIVPLGRWVLHRALADGAAWLSSCAPAPAPRTIDVTVNVSPQQLERAGFVADVLDALSATGFPARQLVLELTESAVIRQATRVAEHMRALQCLGVRFAIDDYGAGDSTMRRLERFPFDVLKIDRCLVAPLQDPSTSPVNLQAILRCAASRGLVTVAEGVETARQQRVLRQLGCALGQGYLLGHPVGVPLVHAQLVRERSRPT